LGTFFPVIFSIGTDKYSPSDKPNNEFTCPEGESKANLISGKHWSRFLEKLINFPLTSPKEDKKDRSLYGNPEDITGKFIQIYSSMVFVIPSNGITYHFNNNNYY
jgi:hypothetical protein